MKKQTGISIDGSKAIIVNLAMGKVNISEIASAIENRVYHDKEGDEGYFSGNRHINNDMKFAESMTINQVVARVKDFYSLKHA